jgi:hypothetical protein
MCIHIHINHNSHGSARMQYNAKSVYYQHTTKGRAKALEQEQHFEILFFYDTKLAQRKADRCPNAEGIFLNSALVFKNKMKSSNAPDIRDLPSLSLARYLSLSLSLFLSVCLTLSLSLTHTHNHASSYTGDHLSRVQAVPFLQTRPPLSP